LAEIDDIVTGALSERDGARRRRALSALPASGDVQPTTMRSIAEVLRGSDDLSARTAAMEVMAALGERGYATLDELLDNDAVGVRRLAVDILGTSPTPAALPLLERASGDASTTVRSAALDGVARVATPASLRVLLRQLDADVPAPVALAALLGVEQRGDLVPPSTARRWLNDSITAATALRALGRAGDLAGVLPALSSTSKLKVRAAMMGLADGIDRGARLAGTALEAPARSVLAQLAASGDVPTAAAAVIVLAHVGDLTGLTAALKREDASAMLPSLHRAVEFASATVDVSAALHALATAADKGAEIARELEDATARRSKPGAASRAVSSVPRHSDAEYLAVMSWFSRTAGLALGADARARVEARLSPRVEQRGVSTFSSYLSLLDDDPAEAATAIDAITVHETYFFREPMSLDGLRFDAVPLLWRGRSGGVVRAWSAGCSSGEEAYTIAGILWDLRRTAQLGDDFAVVGTDVSPVSIDQARRGLYGPRSFRRPLTDSEAALFEPTTMSGVRRPRKELRDRVEFRAMNLCDATAVQTLPVFDVIFCRNVLIYLTQEARRSVLLSFHERLRPGGMLFLGHSESLLHVDSPFELWPLGRGLAYRRAGA